MTRARESRKDINPINTAVEAFKGINYAHTGVEIPKGINFFDTSVEPAWMKSLPAISLAAIDSLSTLSASAAFVPLMEASQISLTLSKTLEAHGEQWSRYKGILHESLGALSPLTSTGIRDSMFASVAANSVLAGNALSHLDLARIGTAFNVPDDVRISVGAAVAGFSSSYRDLLESFQHPETSLFSLPPAIAYYPSVELVNNVSVAEISIEGEAGKDSEIYAWQQEIAEDSSDSVVRVLASVNPDWVPLLSGAREAIRSSNPDKVRQSVTSLRELSTHILHHLSPDDEIRKWSTSDDDFSNKRPTRKGRLRYIARNINHGPFTDFVDKDITALVAIFDMFQPGTHSLTPYFTEDQVKVLIARVGSSLLFLLRIANPEIEV